MTTTPQVYLSVVKGHVLQIPNSIENRYSQKAVTPNDLEICLSKYCKIPRL